MDTRPLVALFEPNDRDHQLCRDTLPTLVPALLTTIPVLTEALYLLCPGSPSSLRLMDFTMKKLKVWPYTDKYLSHAFRLMEKYADHPMDLADASLVVAAEQEKLTRIFTLDRDDFSTYRIKRGHRHVPFEVVP